MGPGLLLLFIVGDILGAGVYAVTGRIAGQVGGIAWLPFLVAFIVATLTAFSYLELVCKYPQAAGAALYTHKAFGVHFITFLVAFTVVCSGITSASTSSGLLASNLLVGLNEGIDAVPTGDGATLVVALGFMVLLALINLRGVGESVKFNVLLTLVEMAALAIVIVIGFVAIGGGDSDLSRITVFENPEEKGLFAAVTIATAIAFFSMVGFEDSVNMVEETKNPERIFPRMMFTGLGIAVIIYMLVAVSVVAVIPAGDIATPTEPRGRDPARRRTRRCAGHPDRQGLPVHDRLRRRQHRADQHADGEPADLRDGQPGRAAARPRQGAADPALAVGRDRVHHRPGAGPHRRGPAPGRELGRGRALRNDRAAAARGVLRRQRRRARSCGANPAAEGGFKAPTVMPVLGAVACLYLLGPWARLEADMIQYKIAAGLLALGVALWVVTYFVNRATGTTSAFDDVDHLAG